ncbi:MAG TPA: rhamnogalacturonan acetylesterase [Opitutaceae bacterium]|nr:rhamnogalacturonan acetylesterase [Opitutaceae bacterium]
MPPSLFFRFRALVILAGALLTAESVRAAAAPLKFDFGSVASVAGATPVSPDMLFTKERGFGFEPGAAVEQTERGVVSGQPFYFSAGVPAEGNYRVTITLGDAKSATTTTIKAELRRLMVEKISTAPGKFETVSFIVNTRVPQISASPGMRGGVVRLKAPRETTAEARAWDNLITLEFNNTRPAVCAIEIAAVERPTIFVLGDSTVCDQSAEPYNSWGQMLTRWFNSDVAIANHGESGETYRDSIGRRRLDKIVSVMKPGDWLVVQFGTNDQKQIAAGTGGPFTTYKDEILTHIQAVRARGGEMVVVSPVERRGFDDNGKPRRSLADYADASRQAAKEFGVPFIDLNAMTLKLHEALGPEKSAAAFAAPGGKVDNTHHNNYGSYEIAKCVVQSVREQKLPFAKFIVDDFKGFDPAAPDPVENFSIPPSPNFTSDRPLGDEPTASKK